MAPQETRPYGKHCQRRPFHVCYDLAPQENLRNNMPNGTTRLRYIMSLIVKGSCSSTLGKESSKTQHPIANLRQLLKQTPLSSAIEYAKVCRQVAICCHCADAAPTVLIDAEDGDHEEDHRHGDHATQTTSAANNHPATNTRSTTTRVHCLGNPFLSAAAAELFRLGGP